MDLIDEYMLIQKQINKLVDQKLDVSPKMYQRQYEIVKNLNDTFEKEQKDDIEHYTMGIQQNMMLKYFGEKIGKPVEGFKQKIRDYYFKLTGENIREEDMNIKD